MITSKSLFLSLYITIIVYETSTTTTTTYYNNSVIILDVVFFVFIYFLDKRDREKERCIVPKSLLIPLSIIIKMPENFFVNVRRVEKQRLLDFLNQHKDYPIKKTLALFSLQTGLRVTTLQVYIRELQDAGLIE